MSDDVYESFQCNNSFWEKYHASLSHADGGNILIGVSRIISFILFFAFNWYNRYLLSKRAGDNVNIIKGLVLPSYLTYIYIYICLSFAAGILDIIIQKYCSEESKANVWLVPIETGLFHWLYEGLALFLIRYGAGVNAIYRSLTYSGIWGIITFVIYFVLMCTISSQYGFSFNARGAYSIFLTYDLVLLIFYGAYLVLPVDWLYRRPAFMFYAKFNVIYYIVLITAGSLLYKRDTDSICAMSVIVFFLVGIIQPIVIFRTLQIDSQYWQGLNPASTSPSNPLSDVWDHVGLDTAKSMAENLETFNQEGVKLPILHFGLINFDAGANYVAGGFSRVYFGKLRNEKVAFKILFAMELTPHDVQEFYKEATILYNLRHENVVQCKGVCVMPPSLTLVLEYCSHGSLFDFLYKLKKVERSDYASMASTSTFLLRGTNMNRLSEVVGGGGGGHTSGRIINPISRADDRSVTMSTASTREVAMNPMSRKVGGDVEEGSAAGGRRSSGRPSDLNEQDKPRNSAYSVHTVESYNNDEKSSRASLSEGSERESRASRYSMSSSIVKATSKALGSFYSSTFGRGEDNSTADGTVQMQSAAFKVPLSQRMKMMRDAVNAIHFLHSKGYMHCDIKSLNFLVTENLVVKLADMGEARLINSPPKRDVPPIPARNWAPPEVLQKNAKAEAYTFKSDIYGLCIVLSELILLELPFGDTPDRVSVQVWYDMLVQDYLRPTLPDTFPSGVKKLIEQGWLSYPAMRPSAEDILRALDAAIAQEKHLSDV